MSLRALLGRFTPPPCSLPLLPRTVLQERLNSAVAQSLTIVTAPAGYGKTCLLAQWRLAQLAAGWRVAWLNILEEDLDRTQLLGDVILSIAEAGVDLGHMASLAEEGLEDVFAAGVMGKLTAALSHAERRLALIVDDVHRVSPQVFRDVIEALVVSLPGNVRVILSGRDRLPLNVVDFQSRGMLLQIGGRDLRFNKAEAMELLAATPASLVDTVVQLTEGWPVALQLSRIWLAARPERAQLLHGFSGGLAEMAEYLTDQVLTDLSPGTLEVLRDASILSAFNVDLAADVTGTDATWSELLNSRKLEYLLVPLDEERYWFRFHHLLEDFLRDRLRRMPSDHIARLHARASQWFEVHSMIREAVDHACKGGDYARGALLIEKQGVWEMVYFGGFSKLRQLLQCIPAERAHEFPRIQLGKILLLAKDGDVRTAFQLYTAARDLTGNFTLGAAREDRAVQRDARIVGGLVAGYCDQPRPPDALDAVYAAVDELDPDDALGRAQLLNVACLTGLALGNMRTTLDACHRSVRAMRYVGSVLGVNYCYLHLALAHLHLGARHEAEATIREALALAEENFGADSGLRACSDLLLAVALHAKGDLAAAQQHLDQSLDQIESMDSWLDLYAEGYEVAAMLALNQDSGMALAEIVRRMRATATRRNLERLSGLADAMLARLSVLMDRPSEAEEALAQVRPIYSLGRWRRDPFNWRVYHSAGMATAMLAITRHDVSRATPILEDLANSARTMHRHSQLAAIRVLQAVVMLQKRETDAAIQQLLEVLEERIPEEDIQSIQNLGPLIGPLVHSARAWAAEKWPSMRGRKVLANLIRAERFGAVSDDLSLRLTPRELEVLAGLARGMSNKAIGRSLQMTENTVKYHLKNIFKKLGVSHRAEAVRVARAAGPRRATLPVG